MSRNVTESENLLYTRKAGDAGFHWFHLPHAIMIGVPLSGR